MSSQNQSPFDYKPLPANQVAQRQAPSPPQPNQGQPYSNGKRARYGIYWAVVTTLFAIGGLSSLAASPGAALFGLALAGAAGTYAYRIWTWQAKHFWWFIIF